MTGDDRGEWNDETHREFEQRYETPIERRLAEYNAALSALMQQLAAIDDFIESLADS